jgi:hypothetical protein
MSLPAHTHPVLIGPKCYAALDSLYRKSQKKPWMLTDDEHFWLLNLTLEYENRDRPRVDPRYDEDRIADAAMEKAERNDFDFERDVGGAR